MSGLPAPRRLLAQFVAANLAATALLGAPSVQRPPTDVSVTAGQNATFTVAANTSGISVSYQWRRSGSAMAGATAATLVLPQVQRTDADFYDVIVTDSTGSTRSSAARLSVAPRSYPGLQALDFTSDPRSET